MRLNLLLLTIKKSKTKQPSIQQSTFDSQNSKTKLPNPRLSKSNKVARSNVLPRQSSLKDNYQQVTLTYHHHKLMKLNILLQIRLLG